MTEISAGTRVRVFMCDGSFIGFGVYMGVGPIYIDVPNLPLMSGNNVPRIEMDEGETLYGDYHLKLARTVTTH